MSGGAPGVLLVIDGWGHAPPGPANAIAAAHTPCLDTLAAQGSGTLLEASGSSVGLLPSTVGNSEIGHLVIGAGRPVPYDSALVQHQIETGELRTNELLGRVCQDLAMRGAALHLVGLCSDGWIHADVGHLRELLLIAAEQGVHEVWVHAITDGRDVADGTAAMYLSRVEGYAAELGVGRLATVIGRGYALDKSGNLDLTREAALAIADGIGAPAPKAVDAIHGTEPGDEWITPSVVIDGGEPVGRLRSGDALLFTNFRSDRIQQLADYLAGHLRSRAITLLSLVRYDVTAEIPHLVGRADASGGLADELERRGLRSVRVAETEKFEHVTYYLNGRDPRARPVEEHARVTGDGLADYRARPEMNLARVADAVVSASERDGVELIVANLANIDVVGHTGDMAATVRAAEHTDEAAARICSAARDAGRWVLLVGDHGNAEQMFTRSAGVEQPYGGHTANPVPILFVPAAGQAVATEEPPRDASLTDVAPTVLALLGCPPGAAMTGRPLL